MNRRSFIKISSPVVLLLAGGEVVLASSHWLAANHNRKVKYRFVVASDGHYGQPKTDYENYFKTLVSRINEENAKQAFSFCIINGDIIHDDKKHFPAAKAELDLLKPPYYVSQGNHDHATAKEWEDVWKMPVNFDFSIKKDAFLIGTTSDETGKYLCPDMKWMTQSLEKHRDRQNIFIFLHINPGKLTTHAVDCPDLFTLFGKYKNIRAVFNGHDHDEEGVKIKDNIPFVFDAHFGGSWGTDYRGFRIVEVLKDNSILSYIMNPFERIREQSL